MEKQQKIIWYLFFWLIPFFSVGWWVIELQECYARTDINSHCPKLAYFCGRKLLTRNINLRKWSNWTIRNFINALTRFNWDFRYKRSKLQKRLHKLDPSSRYEVFVLNPKPDTFTLNIVTLILFCFKFFFFNEHIKNFVFLRFMRVRAKSQRRKCVILCTKFWSCFSVIKKHR